MTETATAVALLIRATADLADGQVTEVERTAYRLANRAQQPATAGFWHALGLVAGADLQRRSEQVEQLRDHFGTPTDELAAVEDRERRARGRRVETEDRP